MKKKRNCFNCRYLEYYEKECSEDFSPEGYYCNGREYKTNDAEHKHNIQMESNEYLVKSKSCCRLKN